MRYVRLPTFLADWRALPPAERELVRQWLSDVLLPAMASYDADPAGFVWPAALRFEHLANTGGICSVIWSFAGPDGRATLDLTTCDGQRTVVWRRIGHHEIDKRP